MDIKQFTAFLSKPENFSWVNAAANPAERERRKAELKKRFESQFSSIKFSAAVVGNPETAFFDDCADFAAFNKKAKTEAALNDIRRLTVAHSVADSIKRYVTSRNAVTKRNRERQKEKEKTKEKSNVSRPFWY